MTDQTVRFSAFSENLIVQMKIGAFLIRRLQEAGLRHIFGVPGDFNLSLLEQIQAAEGIEFVGNCNELNAAYAADGYARTTGLGALVTTFGVGDLSAIGGVAGSYAESVPVVHITGTPPLHAVESRALLHHTLVDGDYDNIERCMSEFTVAQARITHANAAFEVDRVLRTCWLMRRPVHLQVPSDLTHIVVEVPDTPLILEDPGSDQDQLQEASAEIVERLRAARAPAILVDADVGRFGVADLVLSLAERGGIPWISLPSAKGVLDETSMQYAGIYFGAASAASVRALVEESDCLIGIGLRFTDTNTLFFSQRIDRRSFLDVRRHDVCIAGRQMPGVTLRDLLRRVSDAVPPRLWQSRRPPVPRAVTPETGTLTHASFWPRVERFLRPGDVVVGEAGTAHAALASTPLPHGATYLAQPLWGAIGYTLPALFGSLVGSPSRRHILFIGDGSFQLTAQELSSIVRYKLKAIIFLLNNSGYTIERLILGERSAYNDVSNWRYADLPRVFGCAGNALSLVVETVAELEHALDLATDADQLVFLEVKLPMLDAPESLKRLAEVVADYDYGERGPRNPSVKRLSGGRRE
ncbi:alpha-keto acid decarboxylase family protein [Burkholderia cenocepacia]|uniref:alpha-keto acid decarboxylase family protein n=1 Tax=Burkholderia cenocepacia TaxID=95486 RepID=UPI0028678D1B|nr:thiamine pyrophosphate-binding protein [Burkholderia cenocepacia]MDR5644437.1 thiamine pyrophosphate-binding protein [Burkholderia cenocepacia]